MSLLLGTLTVFVIFFLFLGIGLFFKRPPIKGSCGGKIDEVCGLCGRTDPQGCNSEPTDAKKV